MPKLKTEAMSSGIKILSDKASAKDAAQFTELFNEQCANGWNLLTYSYVTNLFGVRSAILATFVEGDSTYEYRTELMHGKTKLIVSNKKQSDADNFNDELEEGCTDGWELVTYTYMTGLNVLSLLTFLSKGTLLATYRRRRA